MMTAFLGPESRHLKCPVERIRLIEDSTQFDPSSIREGVVIAFAPWSGPACVALEAYLEKLLHLREDVPVWVLNCNTLNEEVVSKLGGAIHGYGEVFFFKDGLRRDLLLRPEGDPGHNFLRKWQALFEA